MKLYYPDIDIIEMIYFDQHFQIMKHYSYNWFQNIFSYLSIRILKLIRKCIFRYSRKLIYKTKCKHSN